ncbi:MAG: hypothetical protein K0S47_4094, partial [Herbinix sp.]|nr:hypothetical protein [Herbinix sp.]
MNVKAAAKSCVAGLGHPDYVSSLSACPICKAIAGISASDRSFQYDGNHHELTITSSTGATISTAYDTDPGAGESWTWWDWYFAIQRTLTIYKVASSLHVNLSKTTINKGDSFPITSVKVNYNDGTSATYTSGWTITGFNTNTIGVQNVTVSYGALSTVVQITVNKVATGITANLSKITINKGEAFPITSITVAYNDGSTSNVTSGWTITGFNTNTIGVQNVTVTYGGLSTVVQIMVKGNLSSITVTPATQSIAKYTNPTFTVTARYADGSQKNVTGFTISG